MRKSGCRLTIVAGPQRFDRVGRADPFTQTARLREQCPALPLKPRAAQVPHQLQQIAGASKRKRLLQSSETRQVSSRDLVQDASQIALHLALIGIRQRLLDEPLPGLPSCLRSAAARPWMDIAEVGLTNEDIHILRRRARVFGFSFRLRAS